MPNFPSPFKEHLVLCDRIATEYRDSLHVVKQAILDSLPVHWQMKFRKDKSVGWLLGRRSVGQGIPVGANGYTEYGVAGVTDLASLRMAVYVLNRHPGCLVSACVRHSKLTGATTVYFRLRKWTSRFIVSTTYYHV